MQNLRQEVRSLCDFGDTSSLNCGSGRHVTKCDTLQVGPCCWHLGVRVGCTKVFICFAKRRLLLATHSLSGASAWEDRCAGLCAECQFHEQAMFGPCALIQQPDPVTLPESIYSSMHVNLSLRAGHPAGALAAEPDYLACKRQGQE